MRGYEWFEIEVRGGGRGATEEGFGIPKGLVNLNIPRGHARLEEKCRESVSNRGAQESNLPRQGEIAEEGRISLPGGGGCRLKELPREGTFELTSRRVVVPKVRREKKKVRISFPLDGRKRKRVRKERPHDSQRACRLATNKKTNGQKNENR